MPFDDANYVAQILSEITKDPNMISPVITPEMLKERDICEDYKPRIQQKADSLLPSMMWITLRDYGDEGFWSGFLVEHSTPIVYNKDGYPNLRQPVAFKHFSADERPGPRQAEVGPQWF